MRDVKKKNEEKELITNILGIDKFLMLNLNLVKIVGLNEAVLLTYILDKTHYTLSWNNDALKDGIVVFRKDIENRFGLSEYQQRKVEKTLIDKGIISIIRNFDGLNTFNTYKVNLEILVEILDVKKSN